MLEKLTKNTIKERTEQYWDRFRSDHDCYVDELLGRELTFARDHPQNDSTSRLRQLDKPVHTLALTVGESFEPLLQVTCVLRPKRIVLILNDSYSGTPGKVHGETLEKLMKRLTQVPDLPDGMRPSLSDNDFDLIELGADTPTQVFRSLRNAMQKPAAQPPEGYVNAVDITGAKKGMVVGAFLYAAHSGLPITYVDFDNDAYNSVWGKPYGFKCKIGQIRNPYEAFRLRDWEQVRQLYNSYNFRSARALLDKPRNEGNPDVGIMQMMSTTLDEGKNGKPLYEPTDIIKVARLVKVMQMYEAWDSGDFDNAKKLADHLPESIVPSSVTALGTNWPIVSGGNAESWPTNIYTDASKLEVYAYDELKRIERVINIYQDFRSAFLRAGGLSEVIVAARIVDLIVDPSVKNDFLIALGGRTPEAKKAFEALLIPAGASIALNNLGLKNAPRASVIVNQPMTEWWRSTTHFGSTTGWETFLDRRNVLTHRYVAVSEDLAKDALRFATANLEDFTGSKLGSLDLKAQAITWQELCLILQLDFLPPNLLL